MRGSMPETEPSGCSSQIESPRRRQAVPRPLDEDKMAMRYEEENMLKKAMNWLGYGCAVCGGLDHASSEHPKAWVYVRR
eukprot:g73857.t1